MNILKSIRLKRELKKLRIKVRDKTLKSKNKFILEDNCSIGDVKFVGGEGYYFKCGCYSYFRSGVCIGNIDVGKFCSISTDVTVGLEKNGHPLNWLSTSPFQYSDNDITRLRDFKKLSYDPGMRETLIGHDVWVGNKVIIYNGCHVGTGSVIAAGSIVTKSISPYAIVAGVPAKIIGYRFKEEVIEVLLKSEWWRLPKDRIANLSFDNKRGFISEIANNYKVEKSYNVWHIQDYKLSKHEVETDLS